MSWPRSSDPLSGQVRLSDAQWKMLTHLAEDDDNQYWTKAHGFILQIKGRELSSLTDKQLDWYYNIEASLADEINKREGELAWGEESENG